MRKCWHTRKPAIYAEFPGDVAKWQGKGLQNPDHRFESGRRLPIENTSALQRV